MNTFERLLKQYQKATVECDSDRWIYNSFPSWIDMIIEPLADKLARKYRSTVPYMARVLGPFGIGCRISIHFHRQDTWNRYEEFYISASVSERKLMSNALWYGGHRITFEPCDYGSKRKVNVVDYRVNLGIYPLGTVGSINGFNYPTEPIPTNASLNWFLMWIKKQEEVIDSG